MALRAIDDFSWGSHGDGMVDSVNGFLVPGEKPMSSDVSHPRVLSNWGFGFQLNETSRPMAAVDIIIADTEDKQDESSFSVKGGSTYTVYCIECYDPFSGVQLSSVSRRYRDFEALNRDLRSSGSTPLNLPPKKRLTTVNVEERRVWLQCALQAHVQAGLPMTPVFRNFLELDELDLPVEASLRPDTSSAGSEGAQKRSLRCGEPKTFVTRKQADELRAASKSMADTIAAAERLIADSTKQKQLSQFAVVVLILALSLRFAGNASSSINLSTLLFGTCCGLAISFLTARSDTLHRASAMTVLKGSALEVSMKLTNILGESSSSASSAAASSSGNTRAVQPLAIEPMPASLKEKADRSVELLQQNLDSETNIYGQPWEVSKSLPDLTMWSSKVPGQTRRVWKCKCKMVSGFSMNEIMEESKDFKKRLKWDPAYAKAAVLKAYEGGETYEGGCDISQQLTSPKAGVSSREFVELRCWKPLADENRLVYSFFSLTPDDVADVPSPAKGVVRGESFMGTGVRWTLLSKSPTDKDATYKTWELEWTAECDPKGWIPTQVVNLAMTMTFTDCYKATVAKFGSTSSA
jgi:hypothetical protein